MDRPACSICGKPVERNGTYWRKVCSVCRPRSYSRPGGLAARQAIKYGMDLTCCELCLWAGLCDVHHKDGNRQNASRDNLQVLCPNCHRLIHHPLKSPPKIKGG